MTRWHLLIFLILAFAVVGCARGLAQQDVAAGLVSTNPCQPQLGSDAFGRAVNLPPDAARQEACRARIQADQETSHRLQEEARQKRAQAEAAGQPVPGTPVLLDDGSYCTSRRMAGLLMVEFNRLPSFRVRHIQAMDLLAISTVSMQDNQNFACRITALLNDNSRIAGTLSFRLNVAGEMIYAWHEEPLHAPQPAKLATQQQ